MTIDQATRDLRLVGGVLWARSGGDVEFRRVGGPAVPDRALLARCPGWALDAAISGLDEVVGPNPAAYEIGGVEVRGHRGDADDLARVLGVDAAGLDVEVFNVWIAVGTPWVIELDLVASGPGSAMRSLLAEPVQANQRVTVTIRHRVSDLGSVGPVLPPG